MKYKNNKNSLMMRKKIIMRRRRVAMLIIVGLMISIVLLVIKLNQPQIIGYRYDSGNTVWEMAQRCCPSEMDIWKVVREIETLNGIENAKIYANVLYQVPIYEED